MEPKTQRDIAIAVAVVTVIILAGTLLYFHYRIRNIGRIKAIGIEVYWDAQCTEKVTEIDWGLLGPGDLAGVTVYIKNIRNTPAILNVTTELWSPLNADLYLTFDWN